MGDVFSYLMVAWSAIRTISYQVARSFVGHKNLAIISKIKYMLK